MSTRGAMDIDETEWFLDQLRHRETQGLVLQAQAKYERLGYGQQLLLPSTRDSGQCGSYAAGMYRQGLSTNGFRRGWNRC